MIIVGSDSSYHSGLAELLHDTCFSRLCYGNDMIWKLIHVCLKCTESKRPSSVAFYTSIEKQLLWYAKNSRTSGIPDPQA